VEAIEAADFAVLCRFYEILIRMGKKQKTESQCDWNNNSPPFAKFALVGNFSKSCDSGTG
jgi:hypothetical protein